jgi:exodeoxyribonuclease V beta subunit
MLQKHAFESGLGFDLTCVMDQVELLDTAIKDFWRKTVFPLDKISYAAVTQCFKSPQQLLKGLYGLLVRQGAIITPQYSLKQALTLQQQLKQAADILKQAIIEQHFIGFVQSSPFNKKKSIASAKNLELLTYYCESDELVFKGSSNKSFEIWCSEEFSNPANYKKNELLVSHPLSSQFENFSIKH